MSSANIARALQQKIFSTLRVSMPGIIEEYDYKTRKCSVKIDMQELYEDGSELDYPVITNVPVMLSCSGGASMIMPIRRGDSCLILFADRNIDSWLLGVSGRAPKTMRMHSINDAVVLMGLMPFKTLSAAKNNDDLLISYEDSEITLKPEGNIEVTSAKKITVKTEDIQIECANANIKASNKINIESASEINIKATSKIDIESAKEITVKAENIAINCTNASVKASGAIQTETPSFTQKGKMIIDGDIEVKGSSLLTGNATLKGAMEVNGNSTLRGRTTCQSTIEGREVKTSSGIDLGSHKHSYNEAQQGSNPTVVRPSITGTAS